MKHDYYCIRDDKFYDLCRKAAGSTLPKLKNIDFQPPLTVAVWADGTKTFVKCSEDDEFDAEKGAAMAIVKKVFGNDYDYIDTISYYVDKWNKKHQY